MKKINKYLLLITIPFVLNSCSSYHDLSSRYQKQLQQKNFKGALSSIEANKFLEKKRNQLLFYLEKAKLAHMDKQYELSNEYFNKADDFIELGSKTISDKVLGMVTNPEKEIYRGEDFEKVAIHYYKALNYIFLKKFDDALVEVKRINLRLLEINDRYPEGKKNRYINDALALTLQGLVYEALGSVNDAFIAYRNAVELYLKNDGSYFGVSIPYQLKQDVVNTAHVLGFYSEELRYSKLFKIKFQPDYTSKKSVVVFWENGLVPYKSQSYFTFTAMPGSNVNFISFTNEDLGLSFDIPRRKQKSENSFSDLNIINVSFPKYISRRSYFKDAKVVLGSKIKKLELVQDYNTIAFQTLRDRRAREIGKLVLRVATKKITEGLVSNKNQNLGALLGVINAFTEKSDTRNWQTLPREIYYTRVMIDDQSKVVFSLKDESGKEINEELKVDHSLVLNFINYITPQINSSN